MMQNAETLGMGGGNYPKTFVIANQKGGVGKTVTSMGLAQLLSRRGKVLAIDLDPQSHLTIALGGDKEAQIGAFEVLTKKASIEEALQGITDTLHVLPATVRLSGFEREQMTPDINFRLLKYVIEPLQKLVGYDYIVIDTPPALGLINALALTACKNGGVVIPAFPDRFSEDGIKELWETILAAKEFTNPDIKVLGILLTNHNPKTNLGQVYTENYEELAKMMGAKVFKNFIRRNIKLAEAASLSLDIADYEKEAPKLVEDYSNFIKELLEEV